MPTVYYRKQRNPGIGNQALRYKPAIMLLWVVITELAEEATKVGTKENEKAGALWIIGTPPPLPLKEPTSNPLSRPHKHRVRDMPGSTTTSILPIHLGLPQLPPSHHPLPPKPVIAPPPPQNFHHNNNRPQNAPNRPPNVGNRRNQNHKQRNHPYARRSASPVRHMLVDNQRKDHGQGKGRGRQQQVQNIGQ